MTALPVFWILLQFQTGHLASQQQLNVYTSQLACQDFVNRADPLPGHTFQCVKYVAQVRDSIPD